MANQRKFKVGDKIDRLTLIEDIGRKLGRGSKRYWKCQCNCGNEVVLTTSDIGTTSKSCGCYRKETTKERWWKGFGEISGTYWCSLRNGAKARELKFAVTIENAWILFQTQQRKCALTGIELNLNSNSKWGRGTASLDRIDSTKGYIEGNVQWVHRDINRMKMDLTTEHFKTWCRRVTEYDVC